MTNNIINSTNELNEEWKTIKEFPNYMISNLAHFKNLKTGKYLNGTLTKNGYRIIRLYKDDGTFKALRVHSLVAKYFVVNPNPALYTIINHIDEDKSNAKANNLEWVMSKQNANHGIRNIRIGNGGRPICEYTLEGKFVRIWKSSYAVAKVYNISPRTIYDAATGTMHMAYGRQWRFYENKTPRNIKALTLYSYKRIALQKHIDEGTYFYDVEIDDNLLYHPINIDKNPLKILDKLLDKPTMSLIEKAEIKRLKEYLMRRL